MNSSVENSIYKWHACRKCFLVQLLYKYLNTMNTLKQVKNTLVYMKRIKQTATGDLSTHFKINFYDTEINNGSSKTKKLLTSTKMNQYQDRGYITSNFSSRMTKNYKCTNGSRAPSLN